MDEFSVKLDTKKVEELFGFVADKCNESKANNGEVMALLSLLLCASIRRTRFGGDELFRRHILDEFMSMCRKLLKESDEELNDDDG